MHRDRASLLGSLMLATLTLVVLVGCTVPARNIRAKHWELNETIRDTSDEQLLLNLVRLRYDEYPYFLQLSSITTTFSASGSLGASASIPEGGPRALGLEGGVGYAETPTVTWEAGGREFVGRLHAPMGADQLAVLAQSGLDLDLVFRIGVQKMNRVRNIELDLVVGMYVPQTYGEFVEALNLIKQLRREDVIDLAYGVYTTKAGGDVPLSQLDTRAMAEALPYGVQFMTLEDPEVFEVLRIAKPLFVRFSRRSDEDPRARRLREVLDLDPEAYTFAIIDTGASGPETLQAAVQGLSRVQDGDVPLREIVVTNRSVMEVLRYASTFVDVPPEDFARHVARYRRPPQDPWLRIRSSDCEPTDAWVKVKRDHTWYFIARDDMTSRVSFTLLSALFDSVVGRVPGGKPLLTLPVR